MHLGLNDLPFLCRSILLPAVCDTVETIQGDLCNDIQGDFPKEMHCSWNVVSRKLYFLRFLSNDLSHSF